MIEDVKETERSLIFLPTSKKSYLQEKILHMNYSKEAIEKMGEMAAGSTSAFNWLSENGHRELAIVIDGLGGKDAAVKWLLDNKHGTLAAFLNAMWGDESAFQFLLKNKAAIWAATLNSAKGDKGAKAWLIKNNLNHYAALADKIQEKLKREARSDTEVLFRPFG